MTPAQVFALAQTVNRQKVKRGRKSILVPHAETIRYLRSAKHFSFREIHSFFQTTGVKCTYSNLLHFVRKNKVGKTGYKKRVQ